MTSKVLVTITGQGAQIVWLYFNKPEESTNFCAGYNAEASKHGAPAFAVIVPEDSRGSNG